MARNHAGPLREMQARRVRPELESMSAPRRLRSEARCYADSCRHALRQLHMADRKTIEQHAAVPAVERTPSAVAESVHYPDSDGHFLPDNPL